MIKRLLLGLLIVGLFVTPVFSQQEFLQVRIDRFEGGRDSFSLADVIGPNQGVSMQNVILNRTGQLSKRKGLAVFESDMSDVAFTGLGAFYPGVNTKYILAASGVSVIRSNDSKASWAIVNPASPLTVDKNTEFIQANNLFFVLNGYDVTPNYDGSSWDPGSGSVASPPVGTTGAWLLNYLFISGNPTNTDWVYFSNNLEPTVFTQGDDVFKVNTGDGQAVIRLEPFKLNELIIYKERSIYTLDASGTTPLDDWTLQPISRSIGTPARRSVVNLGNDHWFLSSEPFAVRSLVRTSFDKLLIDMVSQPIQDVFDGTGDISINKTYIHKACAILYDNKYFLAVATDNSIVNNLVVVYDFLTKSWSTITGWYVEAWTVFDNELYFADATDGKVIECFANNIGDYASYPTVVLDYASPPAVGISYEYISKNINFDNPENYKQLDALSVEFEASGDYDVQVFIELDDRGWQSIGTVNLAGDSPTLPATLPIVLTSTGIATKTFQLQRYGEFKKIKIKFIQDVINQQCNLHSYTCFAYLRPWRRE